MAAPLPVGSKLVACARPLLAGRGMRFVPYLGLCAAYLQGGLAELGDFPRAVAEMNHFGLAPVRLFVEQTIALELGASAKVLSGWWRWFGAVTLSCFTLLAALLALRFWKLPACAERFMAANAFFERLGLAGGFLRVAWLDLNERRSLP